MRLLREDPAISHLGEQDRVELLGAIERGGLRVQRIVEAVQRFARPDGRREGAERVELAAQWRTLEPLFAHRIGGPVQLQAALGDACVQARPELLDQALSNLVLNALDAIGEAGTVRVAAQRHGEQVVLSVQDDGHGVPAAVRERIFTPLFTTKDPGKGTGMGLAIAAEIAALHGGHLRDVEPPEGGARFELWLPAVDLR